MKTGLLVTLIDIRLTVNTFEALGALTPEPVHQVVTGPVLELGELFFEIQKWIFLLKVDKS